MSRRKAKSKTKWGEIIRTDVWDLSASPEQKRLMVLTIEEYRRYLKALVLIVNAQWQKLAELTTKEQVNAIEKAIHQTAKNPEPKHRYFQSVVKKYPSFRSLGAHSLDEETSSGSHRKFPSYLRRAGIADAIGIVSSFQTRYRAWQSGERKHRFCQPPKLTAMCRSYPSLYKGQQIRYGEKYRTIQIKIWNGKDWVWSAEIPVKKQGKNRHLVEGNEIKSPALVVNKRTCQLSMPVKVKKVEREESEYVCSVDLGINNAATAAIVGADGTVKARKFINPARDIDEVAAAAGTCVRRNGNRRNRRRMKITKKAKQTARITGQKHRKGFCKGLYRKSSHINREISRKVMRGIVEFAKAHNVKIIVFENLAGWKAKAGRKGTLHKQKFHLWCHRKIVELTQERWRELGGKVVFINPKYTSAYAFDGSGKVKRGKSNYSLCRFSTGKQYHADLNASYNIGARYWYCVLMGDKPLGARSLGECDSPGSHRFSRVYVGKSSDCTLRTPVVLGTLRNFRS